MGWVAGWLMDGRQWERVYTAWLAGEWVGGREGEGAQAGWRESGWEGENTQAGGRAGFQWGRGYALAPGWVVGQTDRVTEKRTDHLTKPIN